MKRRTDDLIIKCPLLAFLAEHKKKIRERIEGCSECVFRKNNNNETYSSPKWDGTRCPDEQACPDGMPHPLHMLFGNKYLVICQIQ